MKKIENYENIEATTGEYSRPTAGGYACKIIDVEDVAMNPQTGKGDYLKINYDIAFGEFNGYYKEQFDRWGGYWNANFIRSYKEKAQGMFKHFINCVEKSNSGFLWDWNEKELINKAIGLVLGEEEYENRNGEVRTRLYVAQICTIEDIEKGNFKVPPKKTLKKAVDPMANIEGFEPMPGNIDDIPF